MKRKLSELFERAKNTVLPIEVTPQVMERIKTDQKTHLFLIPTLSGLVFLVIRAAVLSPPAPPPVFQEVQGGLTITWESPRHYALYPDPYFNFQFLKIKKGGQERP